MELVSAGRGLRIFGSLACLGKWIYLIINGVLLAICCELISNGAHEHNTSHTYYPLHTPIHTHPNPGFISIPTFAYTFTGNK